MTTVKYVIATGRENLPVSGLDSVIAALPPVLQPHIDTGYPASILHKVLRDLSEDGAARVNETLHHAEWAVTTDPQEVQRLGTIHDCPTCRAGTDQALAELRQHPHTPLLVGVLYWAGTDPA